MGRSTYRPHLIPSPHPTPTDPPPHAAASNLDLGVSPHPPIDMAVIVTVAVQATTSGIDIATLVAHVAVTASVGMGAMLEEKLLHLLMICGIPTSADTPTIWTAVANAKS